MKAVVGVRNGTGSIEWFSDDLPHPLLYPRESSPREFDARRLLIIRDEESGEIFVGEGVRVTPRESGQVDSPCYRVEIDKGEVVGLTNEGNGDTIPLTTQTGRRIIEESKETEFWTEVDGKSLRFKIVDQPVRLAEL